MSLRLPLLVLSGALGLGLTACKQQEEAGGPPNPNPAPRLPAPSSEPATGKQGLEGFFTPRAGETWTYLVHRDLPPDSLLSDDDQLRSSDLPGGGRFGTCTTPAGASARSMASVPSEQSLV